MLGATLIALSLLAEPRLPARPPAEVGMAADRLAAIDRIIRSGIDSGGYPGAAVIVGRQGYSVFQKSYGRLGWDSRFPAVSAESTLYDLASLTKVVGTTTAIMILFDEGKLKLDDRVVKYIPEFTGENKQLVTIRHLLTHHSGLPAGRELWKLARTPQQARNVVLETKLRCKPGACFEYSDLGPMVLGFVVERISRQKLDVFLAERLFVPLGMEDTFFKPLARYKSRTAPTEVVSLRRRPLQGEVHDESAYTLGGVAGHAGLFSTANDLSIFAQMMLNGGSINGKRIIAESTVALFTRRTARTRALGWDTGNGIAGAGQYMTERAYGHTGYTGTSLWIDPERQMFVILLTNRVHEPKVRQPGYLIADVRNDVGDAAVLAVVDAPAGALEMPSAFRTDTASYWNARVAPRR